MGTNLNQKLLHILGLEDYAQSIGFSQTRLFLANNIIIDERVRMHCQINLCGNYANNLMCPPFLPTLSEVRMLISKYTFALLVQLNHSIPSKSDPLTQQIYTDTVLKLADMLINLERKAFGSGFRLALALGAGECKLCPTCVAQDGHKQCFKPGLSRPSMEGMGIDVLKTCQSAGLAMDFVEGELTVAGLLLID